MVRPSAKTESMGSLPVDKIKTIGTLDVASTKASLKLKGGGCKNVVDIFDPTNVLVEGSTASLRKHRRIHIS